MDCMQFSWPHVRWLRIGGFNTASGMDCMQYQLMEAGKLLLLFQYRKRYGLHAIYWVEFREEDIDRFNTASGMDCMQFAMQDVSSRHLTAVVSIPQAVWIACNNKVRAELQAKGTFQYRKRYGLHAIWKGFRYNPHTMVSIPQAVWIACNVADYSMSGTHYFRFNTASGMDCMQ